MRDTKGGDTMRKRGVLIIALFIIFAFVGNAIGAEFWGSKNSNKYHYPTCKWAQKIKPQNLVKFNSPEEAIKAGYIPCKVCNPPRSSEAGWIINKNIAKVAFTDITEQKRGCCSWHGGVCGCRNGRVLCCDGTLSPTCRCGE